VRSNTIYVRSTAAGTTTTVNATTGANTFVVGSLSSSGSGSLNGIQGALVLNGGGLSAGDALRVMNGNANTSPAPGYTYQIHSGSMSRSGAATISYSNIANQELDASNGNNGYFLYDTAAGTSLTIYSGTGTHTVVYPNGTRTLLGAVTFHWSAK
jgi:hypothetical protein